MEISPATGFINNTNTASINPEKPVRNMKNQGLGKEDFLKILITQLQNQDPTKPMEDKEFIAQMAQFSSLEQITNMSSQFSELTSALKSSQAMNLVGKYVEINYNESVVTGLVEAATGGSFPQVMVNGVYYDYGDVAKVMDKE